jgi:hypothetical protein
LFAAFCAGLPFFAVLAVTGPLLWAVDAVRQELWLQVVAALAMVAGFLLLRELPLAQAVWLVPVMYALRMLWLVRALAQRLRLGAASLLRAAAGGAGLSLLALALTGVATALVGPVAALLLASAATLLLSGLLLWWRPRWLLAPELATLLQNRAGTSALFARFCRWTGLTPP